MALLMVLQRGLGWGKLMDYSKAILKDLSWEGMKVSHLAGKRVRKTDIMLVEALASLMVVLMEFHLGEN